MPQGGRDSHGPGDSQLPKVSFLTGAQRTVRSWPRVTGMLTLPAPLLPEAPLGVAGDSTELSGPTPLRGRAGACTLLRQEARGQAGATREERGSLRKCWGFMLAFPPARLL